LDKSNILKSYCINTNSLYLFNYPKGMSVRDTNGFSTAKYISGSYDTYGSEH